MNTKSRNNTVIFSSKPTLNVNVIAKECSIIDIRCSAGRNISLKFKEERGYLCRTASKQLDSISGLSVLIHNNNNSRVRYGLLVNG